MPGARRFPVPIVLLVLLAFAAVAGFYISRSFSATAAFEADNISFRYPAAYARQAQPADPTADGVLARFARTEPSGVIVVGRSGPVQKGAAGGLGMFELIEQNAGLRLPLAYPGYRKLATERRTIDGHEALLIDFSYQKKNEPLVYASHATIVDDAASYTVTIQSAEQTAMQADRQAVFESLRLH